jgi:hypothetical protein
MARKEGEGSAAQAALPAALMTMTMHMVESRVALMGSLSRCGTVTEANEVMAHWFERRLAEFGEDQARVVQALMDGVSQATEVATEAMKAANGVTKAGLEATAKGGNGKADH